MSPPGRVLDAHLELAQPLRVPLQRPREPQLLELLLEPRGQSRVHAASAGEDNGLEQGGADVDVGRLDRVEEELAEAGGLAVDEVRLEQALGGLEALAAHADDAPVGQGVVLDEHRRVLTEVLVQLQVVRHVAELLLDLAHRLKVGRPVEGVAPAEEELDQVAGDVAAGHVEAFRKVVEYDGLVHGDDVGDTVAGVDDDTRAKTLMHVSTDGKGAA